MLQAAETAPTVPSRSLRLLVPTPKMGLLPRSAHPAWALVTAAGEGCTGRTTRVGGCRVVSPGVTALQGKI